MSAYFFPVETDCLLCPPKVGGPWLGTDPLGRDILIRLGRGWGVSLAIGSSAAILSVALGAMLGILMGGFPGIVDRGIQAFLQAVWVVPALLWASVLTFVSGRGFLTVLIAIGLSTWTETARLVRIEVRRIFEQPFIEAARALGLPPWQILLKHTVPLLLPLLQVQFLHNFATAILIEAGLGFVGLSVSPPLTSLGGLLFEALGWLALPQGQLQGFLAGALLGGTVFAVYSLARYGRRTFG